MTEFLNRLLTDCKYFLKCLFRLHFRRFQSFITAAFTDIANWFVFCCYIREHLAGRKAQQRSVGIVNLNLFSEQRK